MSLTTIYTKTGWPNPQTDTLPGGGRHDLYTDAQVSDWYGKLGSFDPYVLRISYNITNTSPNAYPNGPLLTVISKHDGNHTFGVGINLYRFREGFSDKWLLAPIEDANDSTIISNAFEITDLITTTGAGALIVDLHYNAVYGQVIVRAQGQTIGRLDSSVPFATISDPYVLKYDIGIISGAPGFSLMDIDSLTYYGIINLSTQVLNITESVTFVDGVPVSATYAEKAPRNVLLAQQRFQTSKFQSRRIT